MSDEATVQAHCPKPYTLTEDGTSIIDHDASYVDYVGGKFVRLSPRFIEALVQNYLRENDGRLPE